jgi:CoA-transferase family III
MRELRIPLACCADRLIDRLASATGSKALADLDGAILLGERAMHAGMTIGGRTSAGGGCRLYDAATDTIALNLARTSDRELLPALFAADQLNPGDDGAIAARIAESDVAVLLARGRSMGLAIAAEHETLPTETAPCVELVTGSPAIGPRGCGPRVVDLSALWAGPLAAHLLWLVGANVVKVESCTRPDAMRGGEKTFFALLNQGKKSVVLDFNDAGDRRALLSIVSTADIVIEAARPRALAQLGIDASHLVRTIPGLVWITITAHGAQGEAANWVGFGDDCGVAGGLGAALRAASGRTGFVGDAIADPLTGLCAALTAWKAWNSRRGGRFGLAMSHVVAHCLAEARSSDPAGLQVSLEAWSAAVGAPFPTVHRRPVGALPSLGEHTGEFLTRARTC